MVLRILDGFEMHSAMANIPKSTVGGQIRCPAPSGTYGGSFGTSTPRLNKGRCYTSGTTSGNTSTLHSCLNFALPNVASGTTITVGFAVYTPATANYTPLISLNNDLSSATPLWTLNAYGTANAPACGLALFNNTSTVLATSTATYILAPNSWTYIEVVFTYSANNGDGLSVTVYAGGVQVLTANLTAAATIPNVVTLGWGRNVANGSTLASAGTSVSFDDFYMLDNTGSTGNTRLGDTRIETLFPSAEQTNAGPWVQTGSSSVSGVLGSSSNPSDDSGTYYLGTNVGDRLLLSTSDTLASTTTTISGISLTQLTMRSDGTATRAMATLLKEGSSGTETTGSSFTLASLDVYNQDCYAISPTTTTAFTAASVPTLYFGTKITA